MTPILSTASAAWTYADYALDSKVAGARQVEEQSLLLTTVPAYLVKAWQPLPEGQYYPVHLTRLDSGQSGLDSDAYEHEVWEHPRVVELDMAFAAFLRLDERSYTGPKFHKIRCKRTVFGSYADIHPCVLGVP